MRPPEHLHNDPPYTATGVTHERDDLEVLVVGAGPAGLFAAAELARHGVRAHVIEREPDQHRQARATSIQPGTLEILAQVGLVDRLLDASVQLDYARLFDPDLQPIAEMDFSLCGSRWNYQRCLPQWRTEEILSERLVELGGSVQRGVEALSIEPSDGGVTASVRTAGGEPGTITASWVLGAGGAHSVTRGSMHEELAGETYAGPALVADVQVSCSLPRDGGAIIATAEGYVLLAPLPEDRWICFVGDLSGEESERVDRERSAAVVADAIERRVGSKVRLDDVGWVSPFRMHRRVSARFAGERRFLLGDAGHLSSPFGGEGLNSGLHDAHNIAWKLALELRGRARPVLLDSYAVERLAADNHVLEVSDEIHQMVRDAIESARTGIAPAPPPADQQDAIVRSRTMLDVSYAGTALVGEHVGPGERPSRALGPGERYPERASLPGTAHHLLLYGEYDEGSVDRLGRRWDGLLEVHPDADDPAAAGFTGPGALLIRPDGHVAFRSSPADEAGLDALDAHLDSYLIPG